MIRSSTLHTLSNRFSPTKADIALKAEQQAKSVKDLWIFLASVMALLTFIRVLRLLVSLVLPHRYAKPVQVEKKDLETVDPGSNGKVSWRRLPAAFSSAFRVVAFRLNIPIGPGSVASVAELLFILGYIVTMLICLLIDSKTIF